MDVRPGRIDGRRRGARALLTALALPGALTACGNDDLLGSSFIDPTEIAVDPGDFLGEVRCGGKPGAMRSYVMTLVAWDAPDDTTPFIVGSSRPASCGFVTGFRSVIVPGERYTALVDGYDRSPDELRPFGGLSSGARQMRAVDGGEVVAPAWSTQCGGGASSAVVAQIDRRVFVRPCDELQVDDARPTQLRVGPAMILGDEPCSVAAGVNVTAETGGTIPDTSLACDAEPVVFDVSPGAYQLYATAEVDGELEGVTCLADVSLGTVTDPSCGALTSQGNVRLQLGDLSDATGEPLCPAGGSFDVFDVDLALNDIPIPCANPAQLGPFEGGIRTFDVTIYDGDGGASPNAATCAADVEPGRIVDAVCVP